MGSGNSYGCKLQTAYNMQEGQSLISPMATKRSVSRNSALANRIAAATSPRIKPFYSAFDLTLNPASSARHMFAKQVSTASNSENYSEEEISLISPMHLQKTRSIRRDTSTSERYIAST
jgi:hypothetical protein